MRSLTRLILLLLIICSCGPTIRVTKYGDTRVSKLTNKRDIGIFTDLEPASQSCQVLGKIYVKKFAPTIFSKVSELEVIELMKESASKLGANALIGVRSSLYSNNKINAGTGVERWGSGIAVILASADSDIVQEKVDFCISILPVINNLKGTEIHQYDDIIQKTSQYHLETLGYYALIVNDVEVVSMKDISAMDSNDLDKLVGKISSLILLLSIESAREWDIFGQTAAVAIKASLINKETREIVWENTEADSASAHGLGALLINNTLPESIYDSLEKLFESFKPYN